jgi:hypothetical protein
MAGCEYYGNTNKKDKSPQNAKVFNAFPNKCGNFSLASRHATKGYSVMPLGVKVDR